MTVGNAQQAAVSSDAQFDAAYRALRGDPTTQFDLTPAPPPPEPPQWLHDLGEWVIDVFRPVARFLGWITSMMPDWPFARILLWTLIVVALAALIWFVVRWVRGRGWRRKGHDTADAADPEEGWVPEAAPARAWLEEADALAARGDFGEAVHHLLRRSIEDIERRRPRLVRPALTSRDLAATDEIPARARELFSGIVATVERSLFGERPVTETEWTATRAAYSDFALTKSWRA
ncbi:DUF4129 domain-containing protein [Stakelama tenebrarum]|uniref:DUF4129 domain-containing protein n=1 Tax=Stakelama tenebrarum TaxID=2711215 RepID=A0A6G6Y7G9_9SPHN|nr:DUF4129 domain-containing protein [Sphingosinithalassobacter tenebrarum]QIG80658.1 DUF4129 domain-containing protein [Sphingosinithalassobacter tenebrarum]